MSFGLGKGFEELLPTDLVDEEFDATASLDSSVSNLLEVAIDKVAPDKEQPRKDFDAEALEQLAASIKEQGILQPLVVVASSSASGRAGAAEYVIVAGERRWRAAKLAGLKTVPVIVRTLDAQNRLELSIIENAQREDLSAIELATAYAKLKTQFNLSAKEIGSRVGKSEASVINTMRLLNLPDEAKVAMREYGLSEGVMRPLVAADAEMIREILPKIIEEGWTARRVERYIAEHKQKSSATAVKRNVYLRQEETLSKKYGAKVRVAGRTVRITCKNEGELKEVLKKLG